MIYIGADHNGFELKEELKKYFNKTKIAFKDMGATALTPRDDYPDFAVAVAKKVKGKDSGILICGSGHGMAITANKIKGVRAALCTTPFSAKMARHDDHANVLVLASWETNSTNAKKIINAWQKAKPSNVARHVRRIKKISKLER